MGLNPAITRNIRTPAGFNPILFSSPVCPGGAAHLYFLFALHMQVLMRSTAATAAAAGTAGAALARLLILYHLAHHRAYSHGQYK